MTWLPGLLDGDTDWDRVASVAPASFAAIAAVVESAWDHVDPVLLELARLRIASLLEHPAELDLRSTRAIGAGLSDHKVAMLARWTSSSEFSDVERACLAFAEQFVLDASGVSDADVQAVTRHLGAAGCYAFAEAVSILETFQRACLTLGIATLPENEHMTRRLDGPTAREAAR